MRKLEERFPEELVVIGVHSAKFPAESEPFNLRQAVIKNDLRHPVVNDRDFSLFRAYGARAWPTLMIVNPVGRVVGYLSGEVDADEIAPFIEEMIEEFDAADQIDRKPLETLLEASQQPVSPLSFAEKLVADPENGWLYVADTEHHRLVAVPIQGGEGTLIGAGEPGLSDGEAGTARFCQPRGLALWNGRLLVADTGNHCIRQVNLSSGEVSTIAGNGKQAKPYPTAGRALQSALSSPWDLECVGDALYIAMAGSHQIWRLCLETHELELFAGAGPEDLRDGPRLEALMAQPCGLSWDGERLWVADSETSSVRAISPADDGRVETYIGQGLFEFGDIDAVGEEARLQHPQGVQCLEGMVYVADTYNQKIKVLAPATREIRTAFGSGEAGLEDGPGQSACFWEPCGLAAGAGAILVADSNNHSIRAGNLAAGTVSTIETTVPGLE